MSARAHVDRLDLEAMLAFFVRQLLHQAGDETVQQRVEHRLVERVVRDCAPTMSQHWHHEMSDVLDTWATTSPVATRDLPEARALHRIRAMMRT